MCCPGRLTCAANMGLVVLTVYLYVAHLHFNDKYSFLFFLKRDIFDIPAYFCDVSIFAQRHQLKNGVYARDVSGQGGGGVKLPD